jgi:hypothetical protein
VGLPLLLPAQDDARSIYRVRVRLVLTILADIFSLMRYEDQLRSHPAFFKAVLSALSIYVSIYDDPSLLEEKISEFIAFDM